MLVNKSNIKFFFAGLLFFLLISCNMEKEPIKTISQLENVNSVKFFQIDGVERIEKRNIVEKLEIERFLRSFKPSTNTEKNSITINEETFKKSGEIDICFNNFSQHLIIDVDIYTGYSVVLGSNKYYEPFTYQAGRIIIESLAE